MANEQIVVDIIENPQNISLTKVKEPIKEACLDEGLIVRVKIHDE